MGTDVPENFENYNANTSRLTRNNGDFRLPPPVRVIKNNNRELPPPMVVGKKTTRDLPPPMAVGKNNSRKLPPPTIVNEKNNGRKLPPPTIVNSKIDCPVQKDYSYSYLVNNNVDPKNIASIILSIEDLKYPLDKMFNLLKNNSRVRLIFKDFESAIFVDSFMEEDLTNNMFLLDDGKMRSREYIDLTKLKRIKLVVPLTYSMWGVKFDNELPVYCYLDTCLGYMDYSSNNSNRSLLKKDINFIKEKVQELSKFKTASTYHNVCLMSDFIQSRTQYINSRESVAGRDVFVTPEIPDNSGYWDRRGKIETVFNNKNGVCTGISNLSTMLLNNDVFRIQCESVLGDYHSWNRVLVDGKWYYFDNTWCITRTDTPHKDALITLKFCNKYLMFGKKRADRMGYHKPMTDFIYGNGVSDTDCPEQSYSSKFVYHKKPPYSSYIKKD